MSRFLKKTFIFAKLSVLSPPAGHELSRTRASPQLEEDSAPLLLNGTNEFIKVDAAAAITLVGPGSGDVAGRPASHQTGFLRLRPASSVCMVLMAIADDDGLLKNFSGDRADVLVSCGDLADQTILTVTKAVGCHRVFAVKGNHDGGGPFPAPITDLHLRIEEFDGLRFGGFNGSWRYKPRGHFLYEQDEVERQLATFPPVDVFVAHNSPRHVHDRDDEVHFGFEAFNSYIQRVQPRLFLHGHQHINQETVVGRTRVVGIYGVRTFDLSADAIP